MEAEVAPLQEQFTSQAQQRLASLFGMWIFLATEILFFGGLFVSYASYRFWYPQGFAAGSHHLDVVLGAIDSCILLLSSFSMAMAIGAARELDRQLTLVFLAATVFLGTCFLGIEGYEWHTEIHDGLWPGNPELSAQPHGFQLFFSLNFAMTGLHGLHVIIGISLLSIFAITLGRQKVFAPNQNRVTVLGLYWHFVDIVWIFLFPLLYLIQRYAA
jgi:cytochrome c oxidase subunit 3